MADAELRWLGDSLSIDVQYGYLDGGVDAPRHHHPQVVLNEGASSALRALREELATCESFLFTVAFVTPSALALLKQDLIDFQGDGCIVTSNYLGFNSPAAFAELLQLSELGIDVRIHPAEGFHPKGYLFTHTDRITGMVGSSNLTATALLKNHEWNLKVTASKASDLGAQFTRLITAQRRESTPLTDEWASAYAEAYRAPARTASVHPVPGPPAELPLPAPEVAASPLLRGADSVGLDRSHTAPVEVLPNLMQRDALKALAESRAAGNRRAVIISATGTGKTMLSALDVRALNPRRMLFVAHREQILDRTIQEYKKVLRGNLTHYGKLAGASRQGDRKYVFATVQTLSKPETLSQFESDAFDYIVIDEAHRSAAASYTDVMNHFTPQFTLGMTATPERTDAKNVFEIFDFNVPYEIRLQHALEAEMLAPFHYYGVADIEYEDGTTTDEFTALNKLIAPERVSHILRALRMYGQAGVPPRGLIFCRSREEARALSELLNGETLRGTTLRTVALTGADSVPAREAAVRRLEAGELDYILTVDVFNEGVDIPSVNQVVMLRQTQSAIVFVQQLGRGLRKAPGKDYLVVIDFIGNYANNFMIPIALFGDESLNKESLRKNLIAAEEAGALPGLSSVHFDKISQQRVLRSISSTKLSTTARFKAAFDALANRLGGPPTLWDFHRFESVDPVLLATERKHYPALVAAFTKTPTNFTSYEDRALDLVSREVFTSKRVHEFLALRHLVGTGTTSTDELRAVLLAAGIPASAAQVQSTVDTLTLVNHAESDQKRYVEGIALQAGSTIELHPNFLDSYTGNTAFAAAVDDVLKTGEAIVRETYRLDLPFTPGRQYERKETTRQLCLPRKWTSTLYGYKADRELGVCPIFVTLHKDAEVSASTAYEDALLDRSTMLWYTKSNRTLSSDLEAAIARNELDLHVFVKKEDAEGKEFYYLGEASAHDAEETTMPGNDGRPLPVVRMHLRFDQPVESALFDYLHPTVTAVQ